MNDIKIGSNKSFGIVFFVVFLLIGIYPILKDGNIRIWSLVIAIIFLFLSLTKPRILTPLNKVWIKFGLFLGKIVSPIVMGVIFFSVVTPTSFFMKIFGKDLLNLKYNNNKTYWIEKSGPKSKMKNQF